MKDFDIDKLIENLNTCLEHPIEKDDIESIYDVTNRFTKYGMKKAIDEDTTEKSRVYIINFNEDINTFKAIEYSNVKVRIDDDYYLFYCEELMRVK